jgi:translation initiation factor IF-1
VSIFPLTSLTNSLIANVALNYPAIYFDGPSVAQGTVGTWYASGTVSVNDTTLGNASFNFKLWDGTTVIDSGQVITASGISVVIHLSGKITNPAGNIRISVQDVINNTGNILFNVSGNAKESTITVIRIG